MTIKVFIAPQFNSVDRGEGGIRRVVEAQIKHLPALGIEVSNDLADCDLTIGHGNAKSRRHGMPFINVNHGMMWADYPWGIWAHDVNGQVRDVMLEADAVTVPSQWVRDAITRGVLRRPTVIHHGIDARDWKHSRRNQGYVLWNKARRDWVSNPSDMHDVALHLPGVRFRSTFGLDTENVEIIGALPADKMKPIIQRASVYLATARETFGIGTLEALASGVPVAGWDYGGQHEIIQHGVTGYLAPYGDYALLADCIRLCLRDRDRLSANAISDAESRWAWPDKIALYAEVIRDVYAWHTSSRPKVSVLVTCHNLGRFLPDALESVLSQSLRNWECLIVDDQSEDNTSEIAQGYAKRDKRFRYHKTPSNLKLCGALNFGFDKSRGDYVVNLDADNLLPPRALEIQAEALDNDPTIHIVCGDLDLVNDDGSKRSEKQWHNKAGYDWRAQLAHINQIHSSSMMRRSVRIETGGYRERYWRAEDGHFWTLATSFGFRARIVTDQPTLIYRIRSDSKSMIESRENPDRDGDWLADFPFRLAGNAQDGVRMLRETNGYPNGHTVPFSAQGTPTIHSGLCWNVYHHQTPLVSVIIPVGEKHRRLVLDALDSLQAQDWIDWEAVVVNDSGEPLGIPGAPYARVIDTAGKQGPSVARNLGIKQARGHLIYFLDADDMLTPGATLRKMVEAYILGSRSYIYSDYIQLRPDKAKGGTLHQLREYNQQEWKAQHGVNILIAKADLLAVGGFDEAINGWEEWDLFIKLAVAGLCGKHLDVAGFVYRFNEGSQREKSFDKRDELLRTLKSRYAQYYDGVKDMTSCCPGNGDAIMEAKAAIADAYALMKDTSGMFRVEKQETFAQTSGIQDKPVRMEFIGERRGGVTYFGHEGRQYTGGNNPNEKYINAHPADVAKLEATMVWKAIKTYPQVVPESITEPIKELAEAHIEISDTKQGVGDMFPEPEHVAIAVAGNGQEPKEKKPRKRKVKASS